MDWSGEDYLRTFNELFQIIECNQIVLLNQRFAFFLTTRAFIIFQK